MNPTLIALQLIHDHLTPPDEPTDDDLVEHYIKTRDPEFLRLVAIQAGDAVDEDTIAPALIGNFRPFEALVNQTALRVARELHEQPESPEPPW